MKRCLIVFFLCPLFTYAQEMISDLKGDSLFIHKIAVNILSGDASYNDLHYLTKNIGGRLAGSPQMVLAEQWGAATLKEAGADNVILQQCMVPHWVRGGKDRAFIVYKDESGHQQAYNLNILALGNSVGTGDIGLHTPLVRVNNFEELEAKKNDLKGKIVFYNNPFDDTLVSPFSAYRKNVVYRSSGANRAAKYGAAAVIIRSMTNSPGNYPHTGALEYNDSVRKIPAAAMGLDDVKKLNELFDKNIAVAASLFTYGFMLPDTIGHNVIGELIGYEHPDKIITVGGHLDSWDPGEGAHDDGAGVVQTIEVLRAFAALGYRPKHTIRFVLFANEENGSRGGDAYADEAKRNKENHVFALESDAGGFTPRGFGFSVADSSWKRLNDWKILFAPYYGDHFTKGGDGADISPLKETFKIPIAGLIPDGQRYFYIHHAATDVFENVDIREMKLGAINMAALIYLVDKYGL